MEIIDILTIIVKLAVLFTILSVVVLGLTWLERKVLGRLQGRLGPTRTGPMGLLQPLADALKLVLKEDIIPTAAEKVLFWIAPVIVVISAFVIWVTIPASQSLVVQNLDLGLFYIIAFSVVGILGLLMAGWGSANKYGALGGLRAAAQLISYEIPLIMVVVAMAMLAQSLDLRVIVEKQSSYPYLLLQPLGLVIFFIAGLAEVGRTPFDIYHAESEVVGGPFVEYSGAHWAVFFLAEYINTFAVAALTALLFLGGWSGPFLPPVVWLLLKTLAVVLVIFWVRGTFPRLRIDQLMAFAWKALVPLSFYVIVITAVYQFYGWPAWSLTLMSLAGLAGVGYLVYQRMTAPARQVKQVQARQRALAQSRRAAAAGGTPPAPQPVATQGPG
ncbi:MAG: NADH-quinone oxidoreductase subunit NuoH [Dehalococcoidia bacterium]|nr:NADH-quinone oxidoreductase subunit NuoH [Dehalococcoidia bacterium]MSQ16054.1 NADH-quinone oxidoreductase subunit NuoH [Dehalococcoidia bacterium]